MKITTKGLNRFVKMKSIALSALAVAALASTPAVAGPFFFSTGNADGQLGALSRRPSPGKIETETADDFVLQQTTAISKATITGLISAGTPLQSISNVEVEVVPHLPPRLRYKPLTECTQPNQLALGCGNRFCDTRWKPGDARFSCKPAGR